MPQNDKFSDIVTQWQHKSREQQRLNSEELDFLANPDLLVQLKRENRLIGEEQWHSMSTKLKLKSIAKQFMPLSMVDKLGIASQDKTSFILKSRRMEYTFEYFRQASR